MIATDSLARCLELRHIKVAGLAATLERPDGETKDKAKKGYKDTVRYGDSKR